MQTRNLLYVVGLVLLVSLHAFAEMAVTFYGGAGCVGGSCALVESGGTRILIDCGTMYGDETVSTNAQTFSGFGFPPKSVEHIIITHAHQDHSGRVPEIVRAGFNGTIWMTPPTKTLLGITWRSQLVYDDSIKREWRWTAKTRSRKGERRRPAHWRRDCEWAEKIAAHNLMKFTGTRSELDAYVARNSATGVNLYACQFCLDREVEDLMWHVRTVPFGEKREIGPISVTFRPVKHIPGAAAVYLGDGTTTLAFSGDLGTLRSHFVKEIEPARKVDALFIESTYGDSSRGSTAETAAEYARFRVDVGSAVRSGGIAWVPAFALDRTQRVLFEIQRGRESGEIPTNAPVYMLSSSARDLTRAYLANPDWFDVDIASTSNLFSRCKTSFKPSIRKPHGAVLLTTSGMVNAGSSLHLLPELVTNEAVRVCLVGYQSPGSYGYLLRKGTKELRIGKRARPVRCTVSNYHCFSGHGDAKDNDAWLANNRDSRIYLIHGDPDNLNARRKGLSERFGCTAEVVEPFKRYVFPQPSR